MGLLSRQRVRLSEAWSCGWWLHCGPLSTKLEASVDHPCFAEAFSDAIPLCLSLVFCAFGCLCLLLCVCVLLLVVLSLACVFRVLSLRVF